MTVVPPLKWRAISEILADLLLLVAGGIRLFPCQPSGAARTC